MASSFLSGADPSQAIDGDLQTSWQTADGDAANLAWAMSASPLIVDELVVVLPGGRDGWSVAAYDRLTGDIVWHVLDDI